MAIADTIQSMYDNVGDVYDTITNVDLPTNKNIQNIPSTMRSSYLEIMNNGIDTIWNNWEKVTGEGETLTLNNTEEAPMKINLKGNTSQETTTQSKNLMPNEAESQTINGLTITKGTDGSLLINGTSTATTKIELGTTNLASGTYTLSTHKEGTTTNSCYLRTVDTTTESEISGTSFNIYSSNSKTYTLSENKKVKFDFYTGVNRTFTNFKIYPMAESGSTATDYVEFVPNSPSPDYPQDIHVASGNNTIKVEGKNLFDYNKITKSAQYTNNYDGTFTRNSNGSNVLINVNDASVPYDAFSLLAGTYSVSFDIKTTATATLTNFFMCTRQNGTTANLSKSIGVQIPANTTTHIKAENYVVVNNAEKVGFAGYLNASTGVVISNIQVEKNNQATEYEAYKGASYPINLPVENLINPSLFTIGGSYNVSSISNGEVTSSSISGYAGVRIELGQNINLKTNDVIYVRLKIKSDVAGDIFNTIQLFNSSNAVITSTETKILTPTITTEYQEIVMKYVLGIDDVLRRLFIQHKGSSSNVFTIKDIQISYQNGQYTPYGTTPIELCKIGTYQDSIKKSTGKNLFDKSAIVNQSMYAGSVGQVVSIGTNANTFRYPIFKKTSNSITISASDTSATMRVLLLDKDNVILSTTAYTTLPQIIDTSSCEYIAIFIDNTTITTNDNIQIEEGSTATSYEPYGKVWYLNKQIGKIVLDGTQNITLASSGTRRFNATYTTLGISNVKEGTSAEYTTLNYRMNDHFIYSAGKNTWGRYYLYNNWLVMLDSGSVIASASDLSTWLSNNNTTIYYVLATPTYTEITDTTLLSQLEALNGARSYTTQTNINQDNNDLPFILDVTALKQLTQ